MLRPDHRPSLRAALAASAPPGGPPAPNGGPPARALGMFWCCLLAGLAAGFPLCPRASAQDRETPPLRLGGLTPSGLRLSATESWAAYDFTLANHTDVDRQARVLAFFEG